jgi:hypothetical protein
VVGRELGVEVEVEVGFEVGFGRQPALALDREGCWGWDLFSLVFGSLEYVSAI